MQQVGGSQRRRSARQDTQAGNARGLDRLCNRIAVMDHGKILVNDTPAGLKKMIPGGTSLEVRAFAPPSENGVASARVTSALEGTPGVAKVEAVKEDGKDSEPGSLTYRVYSESANTLIGPAAQAVFSAGAQVRDLSVKQPSLEEVFIFLTGRHLR